MDILVIQLLWLEVAGCQETRTGDSNIEKQMPSTNSPFFAYKQPVKRKMTTFIWTHEHYIFFTWHQVFSIKLLSLYYYFLLGFVSHKRLFSPSVKEKRKALLLHVFLNRNDMILSYKKLAEYEPISPNCADRTLSYLSFGCFLRAIFMHTNILMVQCIILGETY